MWRQKSTWNAPAAYAVKSWRSWSAAARRMTLVDGGWGMAGQLDPIVQHLQLA